MAFTKTAGVEYGTPAVVLSTTAAAGTNQTAIRTDGQLIAFNTNNPVDVTLGSASPGSAAVASRADHVHSAEGAIGDVDGPGSSVDEAIVRFSGTSGKLIQAYTSGSPTISDTGVMLKTAQPAFLAYLNANQNNVTGDATSVQVNFNAEIYDQGSNFASYKFVAPVAGKYLLTASIYLDGRSTSATQTLIQIITSNRTYYRQDSLGSGTSSFGIQMTTVADMDASDEAAVWCMVAGEGSKTVDFLGDSSTMRSYYSGVLLV